MTIRSDISRIWLHRTAMLLAAGTLALIAYGGLVHSAGAGLSVPDWPTTYGENMFTFPVEKWKGGIVYEHGHRLIASGIGMLTIVVMIWIWAADERTWLRWLSATALLAVIVQGVLGGLTVLMRLPTEISVAHAMLAQSFMLMTITMAAATSPRWIRSEAPRQLSLSGNLQTLILATLIATFVQILLGAVTRHTYSGMAIVDFPLNNGRIIPDFSSFGVAIHFAHRVGAVILTTLILVLGVRIRRQSVLDRLNAPAMIAMGMVLLQVLLGATVIWTREAVVPNTLHVLGGTITFATVFVLYLRSHRYYRFSRTVKDETLLEQGLEAG